MTSILIENFNKTNQTMPHFEMHQNYVTDIKEFQCGLVESLPYKDRCNFVKKTPTCMETDNLINYVYVMYCILSPKNDASFWFYVIFLIIVQIYMFWVLGTTADTFFCPALQKIARLLRMSQNLAGVTLLAFGNGSSDFFTSLATLGSDNVSNYPALMGSIAFVSGFIGGMVVLAKPFTFDRFPFMRDMCFLMLSVIFIDYAIKSGNCITIYEAYTIGSLYIFYLIVLIINEILLRKTETALLKQIKQDDENEKLLKELAEIQEEIGREEPVEIVRNPDLSKGRNYKLFRQFLETINPIEGKVWSDLNALTKITIVLKTPIMLTLFILVPIADDDKKFKGWTKLLNCAHLFILPTFFGTVLTSGTNFFGVPMPLMFFLASLPLAIATFLVTRTDQEPRYHFVFALMSAIGSIMIIYIVATEIVAILQTLGLVTSRSQSFLGCTLLAWGNSVGDLITNLYLAKSGYSKMAFSACIGGPFFYSVVGLSITYIYQTMTSGTKTVEASQGLLGDNCVVFVMITLLLTVFASYMTHFFARPSIGATMVSFYLMFFLYCAFGEFKFMHQYGTAHEQDNSVAE